MHSSVDDAEAVESPEFRAKGRICYSVECSKGRFSFLGRFIAALARLIAIPLGGLWRLFLQLGILWKVAVAVVVIGLGGLYVYFIWQTQVWTNFDPDYPAKYSYQNATTPGEEVKAKR